jgi:hypothetical protein
MKAKQTMKQITHPIVLFLILILLPLSASGKDFIEQISVSAGTTDLAKGESASITYTLSEPAAITLLICDIHGNIVRTLSDKQIQEAGEQQVTWDGRDDANDLLTDGVYFPIIRGSSKRKGIQVYNPTVQPWGEEVLARPIGWEKQKETISFTIDKQALCRIRVYIKDGGPMYKAITGWQLYLPGTHAEPWDGKDLNGVVQVTDQPNYQIGFDAFSLPEGTIFLSGSETPEGSITKEYKKYPLHPPHGHNVAYLTAQPNAIAPDPRIAIELEGKQKNTVKGMVPVHVDLEPGLSPAQQLREEFELYLYIDGIMETEINRATVPQTIRWESSKYPNGKHVITVNILSTADRAATFSEKVNIAN